MLLAVTGCNQSSQHSCRPSDLRRTVIALVLRAEVPTGSVLRRVVLTPHVAGVTELSYRRMAQIVAAEACRMRDGLLPSILLNSVRS